MNFITTHKHFKHCFDINQNLRYSQCIDIDTRIIQTEASKECCKGKYITKYNLCINDVNSDYGICCMKYTNSDSFIGIWSNFTMIEGFLAHNKKQVDCANKYSKHKKSETDNVKTKNLPRLELTKSSTNQKKSAYDDID